MEAGIELLEVLAEAEEDVKNNRVAPINETFDDLRNASNLADARGDTFVRREVGTEWISMKSCRN